MKRYAANILWCSPEKIIKNGVLEIDQAGKITGIFSLDTIGDEIASTTFFNGIILPFKPEFITINQSQNIYDILKKQFEKKNVTGFTFGKKSSSWLLEGKDILLTQHIGDNWKITPLF
jgi:hypothetical protein